MIYANNMGLYQIVKKKQMSESHGYVMHLRGDQQIINPNLDKSCGHHSTYLFGLKFRIKMAERNRVKISCQEFQRKGEYGYPENGN